ncbi:MAG: DNA-directed RNA polymerase subunit P [Candidatus Altiarchaeota archaeon]|nr:DNA-directed RNA polymerase subunit P [Candidatus Altiarchaeota archaeon]
MGNYRCIRCGKMVGINISYDRVRCPFCGYKILVKTRPAAIKTVKAR